MTDQKQPLTGPEIVKGMIETWFASTAGEDEAAMRAVLLHVLDAIREPTAEMAAEGARTWFERGAWEPSHIWRAMIDARRREIAG